MSEEKRFSLGENGQDEAKWFKALRPSLRRGDRSHLVLFNSPIGGVREFVDDSQA